MRDDRVYTKVVGDTNLKRSITSARAPLLHNTIFGRIYLHAQRDLTGENLLVLSRAPSEEYVAPNGSDYFQYVIYLIFPECINMWVFRVFQLNETA